MVIFVSNFINPHQFGVAQELYHLTNGDYRFIELEKMPESFKKGGYPELSNNQFVIRAWESEDQMEKAKKLIDNSEVVVYGGIQRRDLFEKRIKDNKLTFEYGERWLKRGLLNMLSPRFIKALYYYKTKYKNKNVYYLCAGSYVSKDLKFLKVFKNKCFKYGYFPIIKTSKKPFIPSNKNKTISLISVARLIKLKRIDLAIKMAKELKDKGYDFKYSIYGDGPEKENLENLIKTYNLEQFVFLKGNLPNDEIQKKMQDSDIFIFTSNQREGWGAVINEAMGNNCAVVVSDKVGAANYLIKNGKNGLIFRSGNYHDLTIKVELLFLDELLRKNLAKNAVYNIRNVWSPQIAAKNLLILFDNLKQGKRNTIEEGPCSPEF